MCVVLVFLIIWRSSSSILRHFSLVFGSCVLFDSTVCESVLVSVFFVFTFSVFVCDCVRVCSRYVTEINSIDTVLYVVDLTIFSNRANSTSCSVCRLP